jgi:hypothetical protein
MRAFFFRDAQLVLHHRSFAEDRNAGSQSHFAQYTDELRTRSERGVTECEVSGNGVR